MAKTSMIKRIYLLHGGELALLELAGAGLVAGQVDVDHHHAPLDLLEGVVADEFLKWKREQMTRDEITYSEHGGTTGLDP